MNIQNMYV